MMNVALTILNSAAMLSGAQLFGLLKKPPPVIASPTAIARVAATAEMTAAHCELNETQIRNRAKYDAMPVDKRVKIKREKNKEIPGARDITVRSDSSYYTNVFYEGLAPAGKPPVINLVMERAGLPISENYILIGNDTYKLPSTWQVVQTACNVPKGVIMMTCTNPSFVRVAINREILDKMATSGSPRIRWITRGGNPSQYACNYLAADEAKAVLQGLPTS
ncbi:hypothetical protein IFR23_14005 [Sphingomonas sp. CFBP 13603]|uniref:hypothetical protein n=1 Tax=Sphingomonas sp. CFBP 13603 TaxID=2774040 RepID=UPI001866595C|nr:hypothetical protein [Sphingomonas sp. CFBP 13603]MBE2993116.1 hypothetical protein [Sphingomonas sp. CFBP 13603]